MTIRMNTDITITEEQLMCDYTVSGWLKTQLAETAERDLLDAMLDARMLQLFIDGNCKYTYKQMLDDPSFSFWLKRQLAYAKGLGYSGMESDINMLISVLEKRWHSLSNGLDT